MDRDWMLFWKGSFLHIILPPYFHKALLALQNSGIKHYTFLVSETAAGWLSKTCRTWWGHKRPRPLGWGCSVTSEEPMKAEVQKESKGCLLSPMALHFSSLLLSTCSCSRNPSVPLNSVSLHVQSQKSYIKKAEHNKKNHRFLPAMSRSRSVAFASSWASILLAVSRRTTSSSPNAAPAFRDERAGGTNRSSGQKELKEQCPNRLSI